MNFRVAIHHIRITVGKASKHSRSMRDDSFSRPCTLQLSRWFLFCSVFRSLRWKIKEIQIAKECRDNNSDQFDSRPKKSNGGISFTPSLSRCTFSHGWNFVHFSSNLRFSWLISLFAPAPLYFAHRFELTSYTWTTRGGLPPLIPVHHSRNLLNSNTINRSLPSMVGLFDTACCFVFVNVQGW